MVVKDEATRMNKKYVFVVFALFVALMMVSGCTGKPKTETIPKSAAFVGGTEGLKVSLLNTQQLSLVYNNQPFDILINLENKGEGNLATIPPYPSQIYGYVALSGIDVTRFGTVQFQGINEDLSPVKKVGTAQVPGGQKQITFSATAPTIVGAVQYPLKVSVLYNYESKAVSSACLKEDVYQQTVSGKEICKIAGSKPVESSGAPIKVTSVDEVPAGKNKVGFNIKVKNTGTGYPFVLAADKAFPETESKIDPYKEKDRISITSVKVGDIIASCSPNPLLLISNEASFYCTADISVSGETVEQLVIDLNYGYVTTATATINVQSTGE